MKLNDILKILSENITKLNFESTTTNQNGEIYYDFKGLNQYRDAIRTVEKTGILEKEINQLHLTPLFTTFKDTLKISYNEGNSIVVLRDSIRNIAKGILDSLKNISVPHLENSITIKLPNDISDFDNLSKVSSELQMILNQTIINSHIKGEIKIQSVENGSIWIEVFVGTSAALSLIASLTWSAMVIYKKMQEGKILHQQVESLKIKNDSLKEIQQAQKDQLNLMVDAEANSLYNEHFGNGDPEQISRLSYSIKLLSDLIDRGAEVHPALNTPESVANLFPDKANLPMLESKIKQIENKS